MHIDGSWFIDDLGRRLLLRGVNLSGSSKIPYNPAGATHIREGFFDHRTVSFVGRPFPLQEADRHFERLRAWGLTFLRFLITWEAIEHAGPGQYDEAYLDYLRTVVQKAGEHGFTLFIDPHQDVWSRFSGGDGAPGWTLEAVGFEMENFAETGAAIVHATHGDPLPRMIWPTNDSKLASATMFTLFFGGNDFASQTQIQGEPAQEYLQRHYLDAIVQVAERLKDLPHVWGYDTLNEPSAGYIGWDDLNRPGGTLMLGDCPTPYQAMLLGAGLPQQVRTFKLSLVGIRPNSARLLNASGLRAWQPGRECLWRQNGVWDLDASGVPHLLRPDHFNVVGGGAVDFARDYYQPFANRFAKAVRSVHPEALVFIEAEPHRPPPYWGDGDAQDIVYAPHWYDGLALVMKTFTPGLGVDIYTHKLVAGRNFVKRSFIQQLGLLKQQANQRLGGVPVVVGEFGIPYDLNGGKAYRTGNFRDQARAMDRSFQAIEANLLNCTLWNYTPDNTNSRGDLWNDEDLSIFSRDQQDDPENIHSGGRALEAVVRPYPVATAGLPLSLSFEMDKKVFVFEFRHDPQVSAPTVIFVPNYQYPNGCRVEVSDGSYELVQDEQILVYRHSLDVDAHTIRIFPA
jgi:hypothetical protein